MNIQKNIDVFKAKQDLLGICCYDRCGSSWHVEKLKAVNVVLYFLSASDKYSNISFEEIKNRFIDKIEMRQLCFIYDTGASNLPKAMITWNEDFSPDEILVKKSKSVGRTIEPHLIIEDFILSDTVDHNLWIYRLLANRVFHDYNLCTVKKNEVNKFTELRSFKRYQKQFRFIDAVRPAKTHNSITFEQYLLSFHQFRKAGSNSLEVDEELINKLGIKKGSRVLLCGSETFQFGIDLAENHGCNVVIYDEKAIELTKVAEFAAERRLQIPQFGIRHGSDAQIPYGMDIFDCVVSLGYLSRQTYFEYAICEMIRVAKSDGKLCLLELEDYQVNADFKIPNQRLIEVKNLFKKLNDKITIESKTKINTNTLDYYHYYEKQFPNEHVQKPLLKIFKKTGKQAKQIKPVYKPKTTMVTFSGGIDSTYVLWKMLTETDDEIIALHLDIVNSERRHLAEKIVSSSIIEYLSSICRPIKTMECSVNHSNFRWYGYDIMSVGFEVGMASTSHLIETNTHVDRWTMGSCLEEGGWFKRWKHMANCVSANCYPHKAPHYFELPIITKREQIELMPPELVSMTWYCRNPVITRDGFQVCGKCKTCGIMQESGF